MSSSSTATRNTNCITCTFSLSSMNRSPVPKHLSESDHLNSSSPRNAEHKRSAQPQCITSNQFAHPSDGIHVNSRVIHRQYSCPSTFKYSSVCEQHARQIEFLCTHSSCRNQALCSHCLLFGSHKGHTFAPFTSVLSPRQQNNVEVCRSKDIPLSNGQMSQQLCFSKSKSSTLKNKENYSASLYSPSANQQLASLISAASSILIRNKEPSPFKTQVQRLQAMLKTEVSLKFKAYHEQLEVIQAAVEKDVTLLAQNILCELEENNPGTSLLHDIQLKLDQMTNIYNNKQGSITREQLEKLKGQMMRAQEGLTYSKQQTQARVKQYQQYCREKVREIEYVSFLGNHSDLLSTILSSSLNNGILPNQSKMAKQEDCGLFDEIVEETPKNNMCRVKFTEDGGLESHASAWMGSSRETQKSNSGPESATDGHHNRFKLSGKCFDTQDLTSSEPYRQQLASSRSAISTSREYQQSAAISPRKNSSSKERYLNFRTRLYTQVKAERLLRDCFGRQITKLEEKESIESILNYIASLGPETSVIDLTNKKIKDYHLPSICAYITNPANCLKIGLFKLVKNEITNEGFLVLLGMLREYPYIHTLNLTSNKITEAVLDEILAYRQVHKNLSNFYLAGNRIAASHCARKRREIFEAGINLFL